MVLVGFFSDTNSFRRRFLIGPLPLSPAQGLGQREVRGARPAAGGLGGTEHRVGPHLLRGPQQQNDAVHRPAAAHHHKVGTLFPGSDGFDLLT